MQSRGFTKIEVILVVLFIIIMIIIDVSVIWYLNLKQRDIQTLSEISQIRSGVEEFLFFNNYYPKTKEVTLLNDAYLNTEKLCQEGFRKFSDKCKKIILDPLPNSDFNLGNQYFYQSLDNSESYQLEFILKTNFKKQGLKKGKNCATNSQIVSQPCF
jgi:Tfp pilus assembly protein PilE